MHRPGGERAERRRRAALSESRWQRSTDAKALRRRRQMSGIATGQVAHRQPSGGGSSICATRRCKRIPGGSLLICLLKNSEKKKSNLSDAVLCWHYRSSRVGQVLSWRRNSPVDCFSHRFSAGCIKKNQTKVWFFVLALPGCPGRPSIVLPSASVQWTLAGRKKPRSFDRGFMLALPIFPGSRPPSIVGVHVLNFCVRDGNRWTHMTINTNL